MRRLVDLVEGLEAANDFGAVDGFEELEALLVGEGFHFGMEVVFGFGFVFEDAFGLGLDDEAAGLFAEFVFEPGGDDVVPLGLAAEGGHDGAESGELDAVATFDPSPCFAGAADAADDFLGRFAVF